MAKAFPVGPALQAHAARFLAEVGWQEDTALTRSTEAHRPLLEAAKVLSVHSSWCQGRTSYRHGPGTALPVPGWAMTSWPLNVCPSWARASQSGTAPPPAAAGKAVGGMRTEQSILGVGQSQSDTLLKIPGPQAEPAMMCTPTWVWPKLGRSQKLGANRRLCDLG